MVLPTQPSARSNAVVFTASEFLMRRHESCHFHFFAQTLESAHAYGEGAAGAAVAADKQSFG